MAELLPTNNMRDEDCGGGSESIGIHEADTIQSTAICLSCHIEGPLELFRGTRKNLVQNCIACRSRHKALRRQKVFLLSLR